jgi:hypothetical protein
MTADRQSGSAPASRVEEVEVPTVLEIRDVVAEYVRATEPHATSDGVARAVHGFLMARALVQYPSHVLDGPCWCRPRVEVVT